MSHEERSDTLIDILDDLEQSDIQFVLVGGYAISQFETRFSTDLDLVTAPEDYDELIGFLGAHDFERTDELDVLPEETVYDREIELFERMEGLIHPVGVDVLVNGLGCRQIEAEWSFEYLREHSTETTISRRCIIRGRSNHSWTIAGMILSQLMRGWQSSILSWPSTTLPSLVSRSAQE